MGFKDKYVMDTEANKPENKDKKIISDDAYAIGEMIESLKDMLERARLSLK